MPNKEAVRRALIHAQLELENTDDQAIEEAISWVVRAHFALLDLRGTTRKVESVSNRPHPSDSTHT